MKLKSDVRVRSAKGGKLIFAIGCLELGWRLREQQMAGV
jgi:hypothetical protein